MRKHLILIFLIIPLVSFAQYEKYLVKDPEPTVMKHRGISYSLLETGSGLGLFYELPTGDYFHLGLMFDAFMIRDNGQLDVYDTYTGLTYSYGKINNVFLLDLMFTVKKRLFERVLHDSFRPFVTASIGPVYGMNYREYKYNPYPPFQALHNQFGWTLGGAVGAGVDADVDGPYYLGLRILYRFMPFNKYIGETNNHSMVGIRLEVGQRF